MGLWIAISILLIFILYAGYKTTNNKINTNKKNLDSLIKNKGFQTADFRTHNNSCATLLDKENEQLHVFYSINQDSLGYHTYKHFSCSFDDIIESEVIIDNHTITKTARGSQIGGAAVGGLLLGGVGAIIGGLSGQKGSFDQVKTMDIKLTVNDLDNPICKINFLDGQDENNNKLKNGYKKDSAEYKNAIEQVEKWQGMFDVILNNKNN